MPVLSRVVIALAIVTGVTDAVAETPEEEAAVLFAKARALVEAGAHHTACPVFEESMDLMPALGTELNLAQCWSEIGRLVDALELYEGLVAKTQGGDQAARHAIAKAAVAALQRRIARVKIELVGLVGAEVTVDGAAVDPTAPVRLDPGTHTVEAIDLAKRVARTTVMVDEGEQTTVLLVAPVDRKPPHPRRALIIGLAAGGGASLLVGSLTGIAYLGRRSSGLERCEQTPNGLACDPQGVAILDEARTLSYVTTAFMVAGVGLIGASVGIYYRRRTLRQSTTAIVPVAAPDVVGLSLETRW